MISVNSSRISTRVGIVDIGIANLGSLYRSLVDIVESVSLVKGPEGLTSIDRLILPGVGSFPEAMKRLRYFELETAIRQFVELEEKPLLGICLGMQLLATIGEEFDETRGLGLIEGRVRKLAAHESVRIPHVGWNSVKFLRQSHLLHGIPDNQDFYFIHSFLFVPSDRRATTAVTVHGEQFTSVVEKDNIAGVQFHPEKSSAMGQRLLLNFCSDS